MARITVDDCLLNVGNRYEMTVLASRRARELSRGTVSELSNRYKDRPTVLALREIAHGLVSVDLLRTEK